MASKHNLLNLVTFVQFFVNVFFFYSHVVYSIWLTCPGHSRTHFSLLLRCFLRSRRLALRTSFSDLCIVSSTTHSQPCHRCISHINVLQVLSLYYNTLTSTTPSSRTGVLNWTFSPSEEFMCVASCWPSVRDMSRVFMLSKHFFK